MKDEFELIDTFTFDKIRDSYDKQIKVLDAELESTMEEKVKKLFNAGGALISRLSFLTDLSLGKYSLTDLDLKFKTVDLFLDFYVYRKWSTKVKHLLKPDHLREFGDDLAILSPDAMKKIAKAWEEAKRNHIDSNKKKEDAKAKEQLKSYLKSYAENMNLSKSDLQNAVCECLETL